MVDLKMQEVAYQAALAATARVLQPSLVDFLR
jgi:flagellar hook-associated protein 3 FlgL